MNTFCKSHCMDEKIEISRLIRRDYQMFVIPCDIMLPFVRVKIVINPYHQLFTFCMTILYQFDLIKSFMSCVSVSFLRFPDTKVIPFQKYGRFFLGNTHKANF